MHCKRCGKEIIGEIQRYCNSCKKEIEYKNSKGHKKVEIEQVPLPNHVVDDLSATKEFRMPSNLEVLKSQNKPEPREEVAEKTAVEPSRVELAETQEKQSATTEAPETAEAVEEHHESQAEAKSEQLAEALMKQVEEAKQQSGEEPKKRKDKKEKKNKKEKKRREVIEDDEEEPVRKKGCLMKILEILVVLAGITVVFALCFKFGYKIFDILDLLQF